MKLAAVVPTWNRAAAATRCVAALARLAPAPDLIVVVDNGSSAAERAALAAALGGQAGVQILTRAENGGFAAAVNAGLTAAFAAGAAAALVVNDDAEAAPGLLATLAAATEGDPSVGVVAPRVVDAASGEEVSRGERVSMALACLPRTWLRVRRRGSSPYEVSGVLGVAFLVTRTCFARVGPFTETFFAYYEEVDYWLRVRATGFRILVAPAASVRHEGFRGFAGGFTPLAAYLKARNLPLLARRHGGPVDWMIFLPSYAALLATSAATYAARGDRAVIGALGRGVADALRARSGPPPAGLLA